MNTKRWGSAAAALFAFAGMAACGGDDDSGDGSTDARAPDTGAADAGTVADTGVQDTGGGDAGSVPTFAVHYHRPDGTYDGISALVGGDVANPGTVSATGTDGFGAVYAVELNPGAATITVQFVGAEASDPAAPVSIELPANPTGVWWFHGHDQAMTRRPPAIPGENQVAIHYVRADQDYGNWGLHLWGDVMRETQWIAPAMPGGVDPELGAWWLVDVQPGGDRVNLIVHFGDVKDPGPDMGFNISMLGDIVFLRSGSADIFTVPQFLAPVQIDGMAAHWVDRDLLLFDGPEDATTFELRASPDASIQVNEELDVVGGDTFALRRDPDPLPTPVRDKFFHLRTRGRLRLGEGAIEQIGTLVRSQLVVVARDADGAVLQATRVQIPGVLDARFPYRGPLGATFAGRVPTLRVWAPTAQDVGLVRYGSDLSRIGEAPMAFDPETGVWSVTGDADWYGSFYRYSVRVYHPITNRVETYEVTDPYSTSLSTNSTHTQIIDVENDPELMPPGWSTLTLPPLDPADVVIYEGHVRDFSIWDLTVPEQDRGKFRAFTHARSAGMTHLSNLAEAGLTIFHVLPSFDIATVNEDRALRVEITDGFDRLCMLNRTVPMTECTRHGSTPIAQVLAGFDPRGPDAQQLVTWMAGLDGFNWGYDPLHFNAPEGSYASDPNGSARVREFREMVAALAGLGLRTAFDVVYNHTNASGISDRSVLDRIVPGYYHRLNPDTGNVERSTCCDNTATEHDMMEKLMVDSLVIWARDYKVGAFRFDLMGHHMVRNMQAVRAALDGIDRDIYVYGEGWDFGEVAGGQRGRNASQANMAGTGIGTFNDRVRDAVRGGGPFDSGPALRQNQGFATGAFHAPNEASPEAMVARSNLLIASDLIRVGMTGNLRDFRLVDSGGFSVTGRQISYNGAPGGYTLSPQESVNYVSKHDNQTLFDIGAYKIATGTPMDERVRRQVLALGVTALGQGIPFFHVGADLLRSKSMERDSYDSGDWYNRVDFTQQTNNWNVGLPNAEKDMSNWSTIGPILTDASIAPEPRHIAATSARFQELLRIRSSTPLFRLSGSQAVQTRVDYHNVGREQVPGLIVQSITDGACAGADLDPAVEAVVVVLNGTSTEQTAAVPGATGFELHPVLASSVDPDARTARFNGGNFIVPPLTAAVFWQPQTGPQGAGVACNSR